MAEIRKLEDGWFSITPIVIDEKIQIFKDQIIALNSQKQTIDDKILDLQKQIDYFNNNSTVVTP